MEIYISALNDYRFKPPTIFSIMLAIVKIKHMISRHQKKPKKVIESQKKRRGKETTIGVMLCLFSMLCTLAGIEIFFRYYDPHQVITAANSLEIPRKERQKDGYFNSLGLRDREYDFDHDNFRILAIGDSFTEGLALENSGSWPKLTEKLLRQKGFTDIEILNGGRAGTNTRSEFKFFKEKWIDYKPDMVIVAFNLNDCSVPSSSCFNCVAVELKKKFDELIDKSHDEYSFVLQRFLELSYAKYRLTEETKREYLEAYSEDQEGFINCRKAFLDFKELSEKEGISLVVLIYPLLYNLDNHPFISIHEKMISFLEKNNIRAYSLLPAFRGYRYTDLWLTAKDSHPNRRGHEIAAKRISEIISDLIESQESSTEGGASL